MLKVLQILPALESGGVERGTIEVANAMIKANIVSYICSSGGSMLSLLEKGSHHIIIPAHSKNPITMLINIWRLVKIIRRYNINLMHVRSRAPAWSALFASKLTKIPMITTVHGSYSMGGGIIKKFYNSVMQMADKVIAVSDFIKDYILQNYNTNEQKIVVINRGVDINYFHPDSVDKVQVNLIEKTLNISKQSKVILLPARFSSLKGHLYLLDILAQIKDKNIKCIMVGKIDKKSFFFYKRLQHIIAEQCLSNSIICRDNVIDIRPFYQIADLVISPSIRPEAFGRTIIEAQAMHTIAVGTKIGAVQHTISDGVTGFHIPINDTKKAAQIIKNIFNMKHDKKSIIIKNAYNNVVNKFSATLLCKKTIDLYSDYVSQIR